MYRRQIDQVRKTSSKYFETAERILDESAEIEGAIRAKSGENITESAGLESLNSSTGLGHVDVIQEAIILSKLRPAYYVLENGIDLENDIEGDPDLTQLIVENKSVLDEICNSVGRIDLINHWSLPYGGTGFLIDDDLVITNRHVARLFGEAIWNGFRFQRGPFGQEMEARLDYKHLLKSEDQQRVNVEEILYIASDMEPDFALLRVNKQNEMSRLLLSPSRAGWGDPVAVIGYPGQDAEKKQKELMDRLFGDVYEVKRFAPGFVTGLEQNDVILTSDYSSLRGNSGSAVCNLETGIITGLHFAGRFEANNYAISANILEAAIRQTRISVQVPSGLPESPTSLKSSFDERKGYVPEFLGGGDLRVDLPILGAWAEDAAPVDGVNDNVLRYTNFSTIQCASRRLPLITAVNIDGARSKRLQRRGNWKLDGRLSAKHQIGNELYRLNPLDRGHMVRRRDPGWGDNAQIAEIDTFHYTNCVPQHEDLNQRHWVGLEDYILEAIETRAFKASVFTGPIFRESDKHLTNQPNAETVQIPEEFWKIAVIVNEATGELSATGYVLSHGPFIRDLIESPFVFGTYRTYQVQIAKIQHETGLLFKNLTEFDPLGTDLTPEVLFSVVANEVIGPDSPILTRTPVT